MQASEVHERRITRLVAMADHLAEERANATGQAADRLDREIGRLERLQDRLVAELERLQGRLERLRESQAAREHMDGSGEE